MEHGVVRDGQNARTISAYGSSLLHHPYLVDVHALLR